MHLTDIPLHVIVTVTLKFPLQVEFNDAQEARKTVCRPVTAMLGFFNLVGPENHALYFKPLDVYSPESCQWWTETNSNKRFQSAALLIDPGWVVCTQYSKRKFYGSLEVSSDEKSQTFGQRSSSLPEENLHQS